MDCGSCFLTVLMAMFLGEILVFSYVWINGYWTYLVYRRKIGHPIDVVGEIMDMATTVDNGLEANNFDQRKQLRISNIKSRVLINLKNSVTGDGNYGQFHEDNPYDIEPTHCNRDRRSKCDFHIRLNNDRPILDKDQHSENRLSWLAPSNQFLQKTYNKCAIVSSAGTMINSGLGSFIDQHDVVLRFNNAPVKGYEKDVGSKTTIRVLNSQVIAKSEFNFLHSPMYKNITILVWDPIKNTTTLEQWIKNPEHAFIEPYKEYRKKHKSNSIYVFDPFFIWRVWNLISCRSSVEVKRYPPSSGFLALSFLIPRCNNLRMFQYIPTRLTNRCHYYSFKTNRYCTYGAWHPLAAEKLVAYELNNATDEEVFLRGYLQYGNNYEKLCSNSSRNYLV